MVSERWCGRMRVLFRARCRVYGTGSPKNPPIRFYRIQWKPVLNIIFRFAAHKIFLSWPNPYHSPFIPPRRKPLSSGSTLPNMSSFCFRQSTQAKPQLSIVPFSSRDTGFPAGRYCRAYPTIRVHRGQAKSKTEPGLRLVGPGDPDACGKILHSVF